MYGIVLSRRDFREADQIITILTAEEGKREYIARGVKKIVSKNSSHLEPATLISFGIAEGKKEWAYLTNVQPVESFFHLRQSLSTLHIIGYSLDVLLGMIKEGEHDSDIYHFFVSYLRFLDTQTNLKLLLLDAFIIKVYTHLGYKPLLDACVVCEKSYTEIGKEFLVDTSKIPSFYFAGGGLICYACSLEKKRIGEQLHVCGMKELHTMQFFFSASWQDVSTFQLDEEEYRHVHKLIYEFMLYHSERKWEDWGKISLIMT